MTETEKNALWIKEQRKKIAKEINEIVYIVTEQNLSDNKKKYDLCLSYTTAGNQIDLRIYNSTGQVEMEELWGLENILNDYLCAFRFDKKRIEKNVKEAILKIRKIKNLAKKYAEINDKNLR